MSFTFQETESNFNSTATNSKVFTGSVAPGDLIIAMVDFYAPASSQIAGLSFSDTVNTGWNYPTGTRLFVSTSFPSLAIGWVKCNGTGTPTVTVSGNANLDGWTLQIAHYTCSNSNPTLVTADITTNNGTSGTVASTGFNNSATNELTVALPCAQGGVSFSAITGGFGTRATGGGYYYGDLIQATSGNSTVFGATLSSSVAWSALMASWQDAVPPSTATIAWIT
jgi:hypothetical protein